jgi:hypothetical protein
MEQFKKVGPTNTIAIVKWPKSTELCRPRLSSPLFLFVTLLFDFDLPNSRCRQSDDRCMPLETVYTHFVGITRVVHGRLELQFLKWRTAWCSGGNLKPSMKEVLFQRCGSDQIIVNKAWAEYFYPQFPREPGPGIRRPANPRPTPLKLQDLECIKVLGTSLPFLLTSFNA